MAYPKVTIIILNWNGLKDTIECVENLKKITYPNYEIIVVDNGSRGNDADVLQEKYRDYIKVIKSKENLGFSAGNNLAIERALLKNNPPKYVFLLNNDATIEVNCLNVCVEVAQSSKVGIVGTVVVNSRDNKISFMGTPHFPLASVLDEFFGLHVLMPYHPPSPTPSFWEVGRVQGCAMLISSVLLSQIKKDGYYLNSEFFLYCEEPELCFRARKAGYKVVIARDALTHHYYGKSIGLGTPTPLYYFTRNKIFLANAVLPWHFKILFHPWYLLIKFIYIFKALVQGKPEVASAILQGLYDGYKGVKGKWIMDNT